MSDEDVGVGHSRIAEVLSGSTDMPAAEMTNPRKVIDGRRKAHLFRLAKSFSA